MTEGVRSIRAGSVNRARPSLRTRWRALSRRLAHPWYPRNRAVGAGASDPARIRDEYHFPLPDSAGGSAHLLRLCGFRVGNSHPRSWLRGQQAQEIAFFVRPSTRREFAELPHWYPVHSPVRSPAWIHKGDIGSGSMRNQILSFLFFVILPLPCVPAQNTIPTFRQTVGQNSYVLIGCDPAQGGTITIPTIWFRSYSHSRQRRSPGSLL